ncbi:alpha/beta hydrolase-fold protein [uncultured Rubinisphaera sp.]|uniref:alpha/beta hydrolase-fold protein n=1 Tax=uncultured Rubinisphaera sp. TaxID=1678686 RepID=UPI0030D90205
MRSLVCFSLILVITLASSEPLSAQAPTAEELETLKSQTKIMRTKLEEISDVWKKGGRRHGVSYVIDGEQFMSDYADLSVHVKALEWIVKHDEFSNKATIKQANAVVQQADALLREIQGKSERQYRAGRQICGYISEVDHSVQPYALTLPQDFDPERSRAKRMPLYVVLHGRGGQNEVGFIAKNAGKAPGEKQTWIQIDVFGRIDNAYRWAGETDVFEAIADVSRRFPIDDKHITLWGFSMGGAGAWHLGVHHPDKWASAGAGAGFVDFYIYQKKDEKLPSYQDKPLRIYDAINYAINLGEVPFVGYGGDQDTQLKSGQLMLEQAEKHNVPLKLIVGKGIGHKFTPEAEAEFQAFLAEHNQKGLPAYPGPKQIRFVTYTPKYNKCHWLEIEELDETYQESLVESEYDATDGTLNLETKNLRVISISRDIADQISIDGEPPLPLRDAADALLPSVYYEKLDAGWEVLDYDESRDYQENGSGRKCHNVQGPIDDAFMSSFVCVRGTGVPWSKEHQAWADWTLKRFDNEFDKWMRGEVRVIDDNAVTLDIMLQSNLILFGDPGSNSMINRIFKELPVEWTKDSITINGKTWPMSQHGLAMIFPNPLNPHKYIVINSGMTTHEADFKASNSWLFPKLGDVAVLKFKKTDKGYEETTEWADLFNDDWELGGK